MRVHFPSTFFIGYLSRLSPCPCSRTDAPFAQCAPRLSGESKSGSCPVHTPFCTSAMTPQPTEQCVHTERLRVTSPSAASPDAASARRIMRIDNVVATAAPPAAMPVPRRKVRRSTVRPSSAPPLFCAFAPEGWACFLTSFIA